MDWYRDCKTPEEREEYHRVQRELESEWDFKLGLNYPSNYKEEYPEEGVDIENYYYDQAPSRLDLRSFDGPLIQSWLLPYGIKKMDTWMSKQISNESKFTNEELEKMIKHNIHLHNVIKTNLLSNLKNKCNIK
jgi:hypothetical protein